MRRTTHHRAPWARTAAPRGLRATADSPRVLETELAIPTSWLLPPSALPCCHRLPLVPAGAGAGSGSVGPALPAGRLITFIIPSPQGPEGHAATAAVTRPWAQTHLLDLSGLYQAVATCERQREPRREFRTMDAFPLKSRKRLLPAFLQPSLRTHPPRTPPQSPAPGPSPLPARSPSKGY